MIGAFPLPQVIAALLVAAVVLASLRLLVGAWRSDAVSRPRAWRILALLVLQATSAVLLWFTLQPPSRPVEAGTMVVLTANAYDVPTPRDGEFVVALPEADAATGVERMPDLATALRRHPGTQRLRIVGAGLEARDRGAVDGRALSFDAAPLPRGLVELWSPAQVQAGAGFAVRGRVDDVEGGLVELLDPAGRRSDRVHIDDDGRFALDAIARSEGLARFRVRVLGPDGAEVEVAGVPLEVVAAEPRNVLFLAGGPSPELKYLRRWATDAGLSQHARISVGGGVEIGDGPVAFDAAGLGRFDLVVLDERAWASLGASRHAALRDAIRAGLGVLVRIDGPVSGEARARLRALGFALQSARLPDAVRLPDDAGAVVASRDTAAGADTDADAEPAANVPNDSTPSPALSRQPLRIVADDGSPLLRDAAGEALATWRAEGRGRIAVWTLADSYRLVLTGHGDRHARLWSDALAVLARPQEDARPQLVGEAIAGERMVLCGIPTGAVMVAPDGAGTPLLPDPRVAPGACAGYWPQSAGWHRLQAGALQPDADEPLAWPLHVRSRGTLPGVRALALREATARLASGDPDRTRPDSRFPGPRWPWLLAWLGASGLLWWLERSRLGRHRQRITRPAAAAAAAARDD